MPVVGKKGKYAQLIDHAPVIELENLLQSAGVDPSPLWLDPGNWDKFGKILDRWIESTASHLAAAIVSSCSVIDFEAAVVDGAIPVSVRRRLVDSCRVEIEKMDLRGLHAPQILEGQVGRDARAVGGASLPLFARYLLDQSVLTKDPI